MMRSFVVLALAVAGLAACGGKAVIDRDGTGGAPTTAATGGQTTQTTQTTSTGPAPDLCEACRSGNIASAGNLANVEITEASGIAASRVHAGVYYVHNDSGGAPRVFAIDAAGNDLGSFVVGAAAAVDWEDIATGPCGENLENSCIFIGDIGDNAAQRASYTIYQVEEPPSLTGAGNLPATTLSFTYPDGSHDAEALLADPVSGELFVVTKGMTPALYRLPLPFASSTVLRREVDITIPTGTPLVTGGSAHESGVLLRTYSNVILYDGGSSVISHLAAPGCAVDAPGELQGEAVGWHRDGQAYLTVAEGVNEPVYEVRCMR